MAIKYFGNSNSAGLNGITPLRPVSLAGKTIDIQSLMGTNTVIPVMRSGVNNRFTISSTSPLSANVVLTNNATDAVIATVAVTDVIASGNWIGFYLDSTDQGLYALARNSSTGAVQLDKIDDSSGTRSHIGSSFAPTTTANWIPLNGLSGVFMQRVGNDLEVFIQVSATKTVKHVINITTGVPSSQNVAGQIDGTSGDRAGPLYRTSDGLYGINSFSISTTYQARVGMFTPSIRGQFNTSFGDFFADLSHISGATSMGLIAIDSDKVCLSTIGTSAQSVTNNVYTREEMDRLIAECARLMGA